jgi:hypothetical protein
MATRTGTPTLVQAAGCLLAVAILGGCGSGGAIAPSTDTATAAPSATVAPPVEPSGSVGVPSPSAANDPQGTPKGGPIAPSGVVAIGHSGLTGEGTAGIHVANSADSWATGSSPDVDSVWLRLKAVRPDLAGRADNFAVGGALAASLEGQAELALQAVPSPALVIVSTIDNDITCDGADPAHVPVFGVQVNNALKVLSAGAPNAQILIVGQAGRPSIPFIKLLIAHDPSLVAPLTGSGMCDFLDSSGNPVPVHFATLTSIIDAYEAEEARVCAMYPRCSTDGGVRKAYIDVLENFSPDWAHLNVRGQAAEAKLIWPVVKKLLKI